MLLKDIFLNITTLVALLSIGNQIFKDREVSPKSPLRVRLLLGFMYGLLGILLMINTVHIMPKLILDFRNIAIILSSLSGGFISSLLTGLIIALFRIFYTGLSISSVIAFSIAIILGFSCGLIANSKLTNVQKWLAASSLNIIGSSIAFILSISDPFLLVKILFAYIVGTALATILIYYYVGYLETSNSIYRKYKEDSNRDYLTGLNNVRKFDIEFNRVVLEQSDPSNISLLFIDIDHFKQVNDKWGHKNGDKVLEDLGKVLLQTCRDSDIVSRNGGEEFSVILTDCPHTKALEVAERIRHNVEKHDFFLSDGQKINITISIGVATYPTIIGNINDLVERADYALYNAKRSGRNKVVLAEMLEPAEIIA